LRASDVHDSSVRRIDTITPDIDCPKPHNNTPGEYPPFANRMTISPSGVSR
jgi:hypothetical protein